MVGPQDGGFGFDQSKKYTNVDNLEEVCVQCQAGQHKKCLKKTKQHHNPTPMTANRNPSNVGNVINCHF